MSEARSERERYLDGDITHADYYGILVVLKGERALRKLLPASIEHIRECLKTDRHLNNIPLAQWDARFEAVRSISAPPGEWERITGSKGISLSDTVCILKECARRWAAEEPAPI